MNRNTSSSSVRTFFGSRLFLLFAFLLTLAFAIGFARAYFKDYAFREEVKRLETEFNTLQKKNIETLEMLKYASSTAFLEDVARLDLNMKKPGEQVLFLEDSQKKEVSSEAEVSPTTKSRQELSNPVKWWYYFIHASPDRRGQ